MTVLVASYAHRTGEHCASTALRNLLAHGGLELSEGMVFGLASGLGFYYVRSDATSPTRFFHGRTATLENDLAAHLGIDFAERPEPDDDRAWQLLRERLDAGVPVLLSTDTFHLGYHHTTSHFPGHRCVAVGYDPARDIVWIADRKFPELQPCSTAELRRSRNAPDYPVRCENRWGAFAAPIAPTEPLEAAIATALRRNAREMLAPQTTALPQAQAGVPGMRALAADLPQWNAARDWSWSARFGYQVIRKRGAGGSFFRSLYEEFLRESAERLPALAPLAPRMAAIAARWRDLAATLEAQSERETCDPALFARAGRQLDELADLESAFFGDALAAIGAS